MISIKKMGKSIKKELRLKERKLEASTRNDRYNKMMELDEINDTEFYELIWQQRQQ